MDWRIIGDISAGVVILLGIFAFGWFKLATDTIKLQKDRIEGLEQALNDMKAELVKLSGRIETLETIPLKNISDGIAKILLNQEALHLRLYKNKKKGDVL